MTRKMEQTPFSPSETESVRTAMRLLREHERGGLGCRGRLGWVNIVMKRVLKRGCLKRQGKRSRTRRAEKQSSVKKASEVGGRSAAERARNVEDDCDSTSREASVDVMCVEDEDDVIVIDDETLSEASTASVCGDDSLSVLPVGVQKAAQPFQEVASERSIWDELASRAKDVVPPIVEEEDEEDEDEDEDEDEEKRPSKRKPGGNVLSIDCEMVGAGPIGGKGGKGKGKSMLARVAIVDDTGAVLMDEYVKPTERVTDYRTRWSGIRAKDLVGASPFQEIRQRVANMTRGKVLVGHAIDNDLKILQLPHPPALTRDTSMYTPLRQELAARKGSYELGQAPSLKALSEYVLGRKIQHGEHCPVEDARATMMLYVRHRKRWEAELLLN
jgi:RNA exonuclease 4